MNLRGGTSPQERADVPHLAPLFLLLCAPLQGGNLPPPPQLQPPQGPDLTWEGWWARAKPALLDLRGNLFPLPPGDADLPSGFFELPAAERRDEVVPALLEALRDRAPGVRRAAAIALGKSGAAQALAALLRTARFDPDRDARHGALLGLGLLGVPAAIPSLRDGLDRAGEEGKTRAYAAAALGLAGNSASSLRAVLETRAGSATERDLRVVAAFALGLSADPEAVPFLVGWLGRKEEQDPIVRAAALLALGRLSDASALPTAEARLEGEEGPVRAAAAFAVGSLAARDDPRALDLLGKVAREDADPFPRANALLAIGSIGGDPARAYLRRFLEGREATNFLGPYAAFALATAGAREDQGTLADHYRREKDVRARAGIALALGVLGDPSSAPLLLPEVERVGNPELFRAGAIALGMLRESRAAKPLERALLRERRPDLVRAAAVGRGLLGDAGVIEMLADRLRQESSGILVGALAGALGDLGDGRCLPALLETLRRPGVPDAAREEVVAAIGKISDRGRFPALSRLSRGALTPVTPGTLEEILKVE